MENTTLKLGNYKHLTLKKDLSMKSKEQPDVMKEILTAIRD